MKSHVVVYSPISANLMKVLAEHFTVTTCDGLSLQRLADNPLFANVVGILGRGSKIGVDELAYLPRLKAIATISIGCDLFDIPELTKRGIYLTNTPMVMDSTADTVFLLAIAAARRCIELDRMVRAGKWQTSLITEEYFGFDVHHKTIGILGMGRIGSAVAKRAHCGFDMKIIYYDVGHNIDAENNYNAKKVSLDTLLAEADIICTTLPLTDSTHRLINKESFAKMKPSAIFVNGGRGGVVDEAALIEALQNKVIRGAGLDVYEKEPLSKNSPLVQLDNVVLLPHSGSMTHDTRYTMMQAAVGNLIQSLKATPPVACWVNS